MRIVSGKYGGRVLKAPHGDSIRPTSDKIRGAIFNALRARGVLEEAHVLDGFCGTGALGLEALSQGAASCTFVDISRDSLVLARANAATLGIGGEGEFQLKSMAKIGQNNEKEKLFTLVFLDPPYRENHVMPALRALADGGWLDDGATIVIETEKEWRCETPQTYTPLDEKIYGATKVMFLVYRTPE